MTLKVTWEQNAGSAELVSGKNLNVVLLSEKAYPPGARPRGVLHAATDLAFQMKVHGSRLEEGRYRVQGALINATVAVREAFQSAE